MNRATRRGVAKLERKEGKSNSKSLSSALLEAERELEADEGEGKPADTYLAILLLWKQWEQQRLFAKVNYQLEARFKGDKAKLMENYLKIKERLAALESDMVDALKQEGKDVVSSLLTDNFRLATGEVLKCPEMLAERLRQELSNGYKPVEPEE